MTSLKLDEDTKRTILEISALSGYTQNVVKEVLEYLAYSWAVKLADKPEGYVPLNVPYMGVVNVKYRKDTITSAGELETEVDVLTGLSPSFRKMVGDIHDEGYLELVPLMQKKIEQAVAVASSADVT